jgi:hypothetical protein
MYLRNAVNFGLHSAGSGRFARHGSPRQGSTYLRTAINFGLRSAGNGRLARHGGQEHRSMHLRTAINPLCAACCWAEAPGYARRSPPARAMVDYYFFKDHEGRIAPAPPVRAQRCCAPLVCASRSRAYGLDAGKMPALPGALPGGAACGRDARAPRRAPRRRFLRARCPRSQARSQAALPAGKMPALPGVLPGGASCGRDACDARIRAGSARASVSLPLPDSVALFRRESLRRSAARAHRCRRSGCGARDSRRRQSQRRA